MKEFLDFVKGNYQEAKDKKVIKIDSHLKISKPLWVTLSRDKRFKEIYNGQKTLYKEGRVALGTIVQANSELFNEGPGDCPADIIFSEDIFFQENSDKLEEIASSLFSLKGKFANDDEVQLFADILEDEMTGLTYHKLPSKITYGRDVYFSTIIICRKHLPNKVLDFGSFPVLVCPEKTKGVIMLPCDFWGKCN